MLKISDKTKDEKDKQKIKEEDAEFVVDYCIDTIIQIQNIVGTLGTPYGQDLPSIFYIHSDQ